MTTATAGPFLLENGEREIVLVRHASTAWSKSGRHTGRTDIPLDEDGRRGAAALRDRLAGFEPARVLTSPLSRALDTCDLAGYGSRAEICDELLEWDYGEYEGMTTPEIRVERPGWNVFADGCPGGEDAAAVGQRADAVIRRLDENTDHPVILFGHGHLLRVLAARWVTLDPIEGRHLALGAGSISSLGYEREVRTITLWNS